MAVHGAAPDSRLPSDTLCGIVGYVGGQRALDVVLEGLRRLEYRGYDSAGVAVVHDGQLATEKKAGKLANLTEAVSGHTVADGIAAGTTGIGHTRWATTARRTTATPTPTCRRTAPAR